MRSDKSDWSVLKKQLDIDKHIVHIQGLQRLVPFTEPISRHSSLLLDPIIEALCALTHFLLSRLQAIFAHIIQLFFP